MKQLAIALLEQALADSVSSEINIRESAEVFLFSKNPEAIKIRRHWLGAAGLPSDAFERLSRLSHTELRRRCRALHSVSRQIGAR